MSAPRGWDNPQLPAPEPARPVVDHTGEPLGYNLDCAPMYEQPPAPPQPYRLPSRAPARPGEAAWGFASSLLGLGALVFMPPLALGLGGLGALRSAIALIRSRRSAGATRWLAIAGLALGITLGRPRGPCHRGLRDKLFRSCPVMSAPAAWHPHQEDR
jgi:hypothetical protein